MCKFRHNAHLQCLQWLRHSFLPKKRKADFGHQKAARVWHPPIWSLRNDCR
nr:MAG TPA: hypothetical protein [Caudoviricetes sp.]